MHGERRGEAIPRKVDTLHGPQRESPPPETKEPSITRRDFLKLVLALLIAFLTEELGRHLNARDSRTESEEELKSNFDVKRAYLPKFFSADFTDPASMEEYWTPETQGLMIQILPITHQEIFEQIKRLSTTRSPKEKSLLSIQSAQPDLESTRLHIIETIEDLNTVWEQYQEVKSIFPKNSPIVEIFYRQYQEVASYLQMWIDITQKTVLYSAPEVATEIYFSLIKDRCRQIKDSESNCQNIPAIKGILNIPKNYIWVLYPYSIDAPRYHPGLLQFSKPIPLRGKQKPYNSSLVIYRTITNAHQWDNWHKRVKFWLKIQGWPSQEPTMLNFVLDRLPPKEREDLEGVLPQIRRTVDELSLGKAFGIIELVEEFRDNPKTKGRTILNFNGSSIIKIREQTLKFNIGVFTFFVLFHELFHFLAQKSLGLEWLDYLQVRNLMLKLFHTINPFTTSHTIQLGKTNSCILYSYPYAVVLNPSKFYMKKTPSKILELPFDIISRSLGFSNLKELSKSLKEKNPNPNNTNKEQVVLEEIRKICSQIDSSSEPEEKILKAVLLHISLYPPQTLLQLDDLREGLENVAKPLALYTSIYTEGFEESLANIFGAALALETPYYEELKQKIKENFGEYLPKAQAIIYQLINYLKGKKLAMEGTQSKKAT